MKIRNIIFISVVCLALVSITACENGKDKQNKDNKQAVENNKKSDILYNNYGVYLRDGEWIYYKYNYNIYRIKIDGSYVQKINNNQEVEVYDDDPFVQGKREESKICIIDGWIYFSGRDVVNNKYGTFRIKEDGSSWEYVCEYMGIINDGYIYYSDENGIHRVSLEEKEDNILVYENNIEYINYIIDGYIYYELKERDFYKEDLDWSETRGKSENSFRRVKLDGSNEEILLDLSEWYDRMDVKIYDEWIYYGNTTKTDSSLVDSSTLYRKKIDGKNKEEILNFNNMGAKTNICVYDDTIYFTYRSEDENANETNITLKINKEGEETLQINEIGSENISYLDYVDNECAVLGTYDTAAEKAHKYIVDWSFKNVVEVKGK